MRAVTTQKPEYHQRTGLPEAIVLKRVGGGKPRRERCVVVLPDASANHAFCAHNNDLPNMLRALTERVYKVEERVQGKKSGRLVPTPKPEPGAWRRLTPIADKVVNTLNARISRRGERSTLEKLSVQEFLEQCPANKRKVYERAAAVYESIGCSRKHSYVKAFVKCEKINFTKKVDPAPRVIQPRDPVYVLALGRYTRRVEHEMYEALAEVWNGDDDPTNPVVMKGLTVTEVGAAMRVKWDRFKRPVAIGLDASRFDQHISADALKWEHYIYRKLFGMGDVELKELLKWQVANVACTYVDEWCVRYKVHGCRMSGDPNTGLGNCAIMVGMLRRLMDICGAKWELANNGDDCVLIMDESDLDRLGGMKAFSNIVEGFFLELGIEMEVEEPVRDFERVVFCQTQPVWSGSEWVMVRQLDVAMCKDAMALAVDSEHEFRQWSYQVGIGGHALYGDMPVFNELYAMYRRNGVRSNVGRSLNVSDSGFMRMAKVPRVRSSDVTRVSDSCRVSFFKAFGLPPSHQLDLEDRFRSMQYAGIADRDMGLATCVGQVIPM